jgi:hypothetical protein
MRFAVARQHEAPLPVGGRQVRGFARPPSLPAGGRRVLGGAGAATLALMAGGVCRAACAPSEDGLGGGYREVVASARRGS